MRVLKILMKLTNQTLNFRNASFKHNVNNINDIHRTNNNNTDAATQMHLLEYIVIQYLILSLLWLHLTIGITACARNVPLFEFSGQCYSLKRPIRIFPVRDHK